MMRSRCGTLAILFAALPLSAQETGWPDTDPQPSAIPRTQTKRARIAAVTAPAHDFTAPEPFEANPDGAGSVCRRPDAQAFSLPQENLNFAQQSTFAIGSGLFERLRVTAPASTIASDGLGPLFNARSCQDCHIKDGCVHAPDGPDDMATSLVVRLGIPQVDGDALSRYFGASPDPTYGHQFSDTSIAGIDAEGRVRVDWTDAGKVALPGGETVPLRRPDWTLEALAYGPLDATTALSPRVVPQMIGLGLVEAIPAADILAHADPEDADGDGISGRPNVVWAPEYDRPQLRRFDVRATTPTLRQQAAEGFNADIGLASPLHPDSAGDCTEAQVACRAARDGRDARQGWFEISDGSLDLVTFYSRTLAVPKRDDMDSADVLRGKALFAQA